MEIGRVDVKGSGVEDSSASLALDEYWFLKHETTEVNARYP